MQLKMIKLCLIALIGAAISLFPRSSESTPKNLARPEGNLYAASYAGEAAVIVVGEGGKIYRSTDDLETWTQVPVKTRESLFSVCFPDASNGWICGQNGIILHSNDSGKSWKEQNSGASDLLFALDFFDNRNGIAVGANGFVTCSVDGGNTWKSILLEDGTSLYGAVMMDDRQACISGERGRIFIVDITGPSIEEIRTFLYDETMMEGRTLFSLTKDKDEIYGVGMDSVVVHSSDKGRSWVQDATPIAPQELYGIEIAGDMGWAVGGGGNLMRSIDRGKTWRIVQVPAKFTEKWLIAVRAAKHRSGDVTGIIIGENGTIGRIRGNEVMWRK